ncbi:Hypothetical predicted protein [Mytilus galloprovincialis]|uniref:Ig-like domain-containing protein n=1 Tax=Mytilus galloprovincialis TaxID=29158 RepID=A0A8B6EVY4_MYTGA|nr:Hypothetical predicted protein [Mytilus galloprovincialis]
MKPSRYKEINLTVSGVFKWTVVGKATDYGQNVTLFCHVPNCCPEDAGWDRWTPQQRTLFIDVKTGRPNKKYDGRIFKNGYTLIIQNLTKDDLNVSYSCLYGVTLGDRKFLQEEDVFTYVKGGSGSSNNEDPSIDPEAGQKSEPDCCDGGRGSAISVLTFKNSEVKAESKPDCVNFAEQNESGNVKKTSYDHKDNTRSKDAHEIPNKNEIKEYMDAIQSRYEVRKYVRIQVIGKDGVGKTSLVRRLLNQDCKDVTSTDGIDISRKCHIKESDGTWMFANGEFPAFISYLKKSL